MSQDDWWRFLYKIQKRDLSTLYIDEIDDIINNIKLFNDSKKLYKQYGITYKLNMLFHGPPGTGKSSLLF